MIFIPPFPLVGDCFADDIDHQGGSTAVLHDITTTLEKTVGCYGMEISIEKNKILVSCTRQYAATGIMLSRQA